MHRVAARMGIVVALASCTGSPEPAIVTHDEAREATDGTSPRDRTEVVTFDEIAPGVWMHSSLREVPPWGPVVSHGLVVVAGEGSVLVDSAWDDAQTGQILDWARGTLGKPVKRAVVTHAHADKMGGVGMLRRRGVATHALARSNALAPARGFVPAEHALVIDEEGLSADLAPLVVLHPGAGHAEDNLVVWVPHAKVLFGGCLIRPGAASDLGNTADADVETWDDAVRRVQAQFGDAAVVVPSHGPPGGPELLDHTIELVEQMDETQGPALRVAVEVRAERSADHAWTKKLLERRELYAACRADASPGEVVAGRAMVRSMHFADETWSTKILPGQGRVCDPAALRGAGQPETSACGREDDCYRFGCQHLDVVLPATPLPVSSAGVSACVARVLEEQLPRPEGAYVLVEVVLESRP